MKILLAVDGSEQSLKAVDYLVAHIDDWRERPHVDLVTVHLPVPHPPGMHLVVGKNQVEAYYEEEGQACLAEARRRLSSAGVMHEARVLVGQVAETLAAEAKKGACDLILIATHGHGAAMRMVLGSVATGVLHLSAVPILLVK